MDSFAWGFSLVIRAEYSGFIFGLRAPKPQVGSSLYALGTMYRVFWLRLSTAQSKNTRRDSSARSSNADTARAGERASPGSHRALPTAADYLAGVPDVPRGAQFKTSVAS